jgi:2-phospho-L-lactate guanylyltransferase
LVPVKAFAHAKRRLTAALDDEIRLALVRSMAEQVLRAAAPLPVAVVCDDPEVAEWARSHGALVLWEPGRGLNGAVQSGVAQLGEMGVRRVVVAHADLPLARDLAALVGFDGVTLVPDRRDDGTNVIALPTDAGFGFSYGPGSFARHRAECDRLGLVARVVREPVLSYDVDWPSDLPSSVLAGEDREVD